MTAMGRKDSEQPRPTAASRSNSGISPASTHHQSPLTYDIVCVIPGDTEDYLAIAELVGGFYMHDQHTICVIGAPHLVGAMPIMTLTHGGTEYDG